MKGTATGTIHIPGGLGAKTINVSLPVTGAAGPNATRAESAELPVWVQELIQWITEIQAKS